jgi:hypothetical protein
VSDRFFKVTLYVEADFAANALIQFLYDDEGEPVRSIIASGVSEVMIEDE